MDLKLFRQDIFLHIGPSNKSHKFFAKGLKSEGERLNVKFWSSEMVKVGRGSAQLSLLSPLPPRSEFCNDENNHVIRSAMVALRNSRKKPPSSSLSLFIHIFQFDFGCTS